MLPHHRTTPADVAEAPDADMLAAVMHQDATPDIPARLTGLTGNTDGQPPRLAD